MILSARMTALSLASETDVKFLGEASIPTRALMCCACVHE